MKNVIKTKREALGLTLADVAEACGVAASSVQRWESGDIANMKRDKIVRLCQVLHLSPYEILGMEDNRIHTVKVQRKSIPLVGHIAAGTPIQANETYDTYIDADSDFRCDYALIVDGDSMEPTVQRGDLVFIRQQPDVDDGQVAAVLIDDTATLKRIYHVPNGLTLVSDNTTKYPPRTVTMPEYDTIQILGLAVAFKRRI